MSLKTLTLNGTELVAWLEQLADLRIRVFRDYPYLYDGSPEYERRYLGRYCQNPRFICQLAIDNKRVVGATTGMPLVDETAEFQAPFVSAGIPTESVFYCAESLLLPDYRGQGLYRQFFATREAQARSLGLKICAFCAVVRPDNHPLRPQGYQSLDDIWARFGYAPAAGMVTRFAWQDIGDTGESDKPMQFYLKDIR